MSFVDDLRNGEFDKKEEWTPSLHDKRVIQGFLEELQKEIIERNAKGERSFDGYLAYCCYDKDYYRTIPTNEKIALDDLGANALGVNRYNNEDYFKFLQNEIEVGLKELGFNKVSVKPAYVQLYRTEVAYFFKTYKLVKDKVEETLEISFSW